MWVGWGGIDYKGDIAMFFREFLIDDTDTLLSGNRVTFSDNFDTMCIYDENAREKEKQMKEVPFYGKLYKTCGSLIVDNDGNAIGFKFDDFNNNFLKQLYETMVTKGD